MTDGGRSTDASSALHYRDFRLFLAMRTLASMGQLMQTVAVGWQVYDLTHQAIDLGYVGLALFLPQMLFVLPAGHAADRFDRRSVIMAGLVVSAACPLALLALDRAGVLRVDAIFALLFVYGVGRAYWIPTMQSLLPQTVPRAVLPNAMSWRSSIGQVAVVAGPALGGLLYGLGAPLVYGCVAALTLLALAATALIAPRREAAGKTGRSIGELLAGVRYVRTHPVLLGAISLDLFAVLLGGASALLPAYARDILTVGPLGLGLLRSAPALGAGTCALWLARRPLRRHAGRTMFLCVAGFGAGTVIFGLSKYVPLSLAALALMGACDMVSVYIRQTLVQLGTPDAMRGRVTAVSQVFIGASNELGEFESGVTAAWFGTIAAVVVGGVGTLAVVALWAWRFRGLRQVDRLEDVYAEDAG